MEKKYEKERGEKEEEEQMTRWRVTVVTAGKLEH
jgi:hypothetical protein